MTVYTKTYDLGEINKKEVMRYAGSGENAAFPDEILDECIGKAKNALSCKVCYAVFDVKICENNLDFGAFSVKSKNLAKNLKNCEKAVIFAATLGVGIDRLIAKYSAVSPSTALIFQALGAERVEALCDAFCEDIKKEFGAETRPRFSPGYGDFDIFCQKDIFAVLNCEKHIGLTLNDSMLMSPSKSVTAVVGIKTKKI
ncbi:MAG: Vitamin B12 dependent methionine synthase activation subunit [Clostridiales bacterium]|nr:Vitamin B12 dependent methionine synthase activation subunit [Clostridiales bacterium]